MNKYALALAMLIATPASAELSNAEFFRMDRNEWVAPQPQIKEVASKSPVAAMVAREAEAKLGPQWVQTALKLTKIESGFNCNAVGPKTRHGRAQGLLQVMPGTARAMGFNPTRLRECQYGLAAGIEHMRRCIETGVRTHAQMSSCHVSGFHGWKIRLNTRAEKYRNKYIRLARR